MITELKTLSDFHAAVACRDGYIVIVDSARAPQLAHPADCQSVQSEHFHEKVILHGGKSDRYYWASTFSEAQQCFGAERYRCA